MTLNETMSPYFLFQYKYIYTDKYDILMTPYALGTLHVAMK